MWFERKRGGNPYSRNGWCIFKSVNSSLQTNNLQDKQHSSITVHLLNKYSGERLRNERKIAFFIIFSHAHFMGTKHTPIPCFIRNL